MSIATGPAAAARKAAIPAVAGAGSTAWQVGVAPVQTSFTSQSPLLRQMHSVPLLQNGASGVHPVVGVHTRQMPCPPLAAVSQIGVDAAQSPDPVHPHTLSPRHTGRVAVQSGFPRHSTHTPGAGEVRQRAVGAEQSPSPAQPRHWPAPPLAAVSQTWEAAQPSVAVHTTQRPFPLLAEVSQTPFGAVQSPEVVQPQTLLARQAGRCGLVQSAPARHSTQVPGGGAVRQRGVPPEQSPSPAQPRHAPCPPFAAGSHTCEPAQPSGAGTSTHTLQVRLTWSQTRFGSTVQSPETRHPTQLPAPMFAAVSQTGEPEVQPGSRPPSRESTQFLHIPAPPDAAVSQNCGAVQPWVEEQTTHAPLPPAPAGSQTGAEAVQPGAVPVPETRQVRQAPVLPALTSQNGVAPPHPWVAVQVRQRDPA
jgi:hypothetical protein